MRKDDLVEIFGRDLLSDESQLPGFLDLLSAEEKPFECVGTRAEVRAAFGLLRGDAGWREAPVVKAVCEQHGITPFRLEHAKGVLKPTGEHAIPTELASKLGL
jgi:UDP-N-acetyl-alpha-D-muramoyl-L-alanyl-L-glutamate epimerase